MSSTPEDISDENLSAMASSMSRDRVNGMLSKLLVIGEDADMSAPLEGKNKEIADLISRLSQNDWSCLCDVRKHYIESTQYDDSTESVEGAIEMADIDIEVIRTEMGMVAMRIKDIPGILENVRKIATENDIPHIDKIVTYAKFLAGSESLENVDEDITLIFDIMIAASEIAENNDNYTYAYIVLECVDLMTSDLSFGEDF